MRTLCLLAAVVVLIFSLPTMAGMTSVEDEDLATVSGETGITLAIQSLNMEFDDWALGDSNGFGTTYTGVGWMVLSNITTPSQITITQLSIDVGYSDVKGYTVLQLDLGTGNLIQGNLTIGSLLLATTATGASGARVGEVDITNMAVKTGMLKLKGHKGT